MPGTAKLHVCYISGLDLRRVTPSDTPVLHAATIGPAFVPLRNAPGNELFPTLVTGVSPPRHGVWGVRLAPRARTIRDRVTDLLPDLLATTVQCLRHWADHRFDLAAVPPRRRRRFRIARTKYKRRTHRTEALFRIGGVPTVFDAVGAHRGRYLFSASYVPHEDVLPRVGAGDVDLEVLELYSLDRHQQWNLDDAAETRRFHRVVDDFLAALRRRAAANDVRVMVVSDHGHQPIEESIDLHALLRDAGIGPDRADWFVEVSSARFWVHDAGARKELVDRLHALGRGTLCTWQEMRGHGIALEDDGFGQLFYFLDPGRIFFPHDFHHPAANLWLGLSDPLQRNRLRDPRHRGNHGHLPHFAAERSFATVLGDARALRPSGHIVDVAPSILALLGYAPGDHVEGVPLFAA